MYVWKRRKKKWKSTAFVYVCVRCTTVTVRWPVGRSVVVALRTLNFKSALSRNKYLVWPLSKMIGQIRNKSLFEFILGSGQRNRPNVRILTVPLLEITTFLQSRRCESIRPSVSHPLAQCLARVSCTIYFFLCCWCPKYVKYEKV